MITIRSAHINEVKELQDLNDKAFTENLKYDADFFAEWSHSKYAKDYFIKTINNPNALCLIVEDRGLKIGYAIIAPKTINYCRSKYCEIENLGIIPEYRKKGIGKMLLGKCFE